MGGGGEGGRDLCEGKGWFRVRCDVVTAEKKGFGRATRLPLGPRGASEEK